MATLVERLREITSTKDDDFFDDDTLLYYLNSAKTSVVSYLIEKDSKSYNNLRSLDLLRQVIDVSTYVGTAQVGTYYKTNITVSSILSFTNLFYNGTIPLRQLNSSQLINLSNGSIKPSSFESYYHVITDSSGKKFELYLYESPTNSTDIVSVYCVGTPTVIVLGDTAIDDLPTTLLNAVIYGAAALLLSQDSVEGSPSSVSVYQERFKLELELNSY